MSSESQSAAQTDQAAGAFDLAALVHGDDRADLSGQADHDALKRAQQKSAQQATDEQGRPTRSSTGDLLDYAKKVPVRPATSVIILRQAPDLQVFVQHRVTTMDFAAGVVVFPGGRVDLQDVEEAAGLPVDPADLDRHLTAWSQTDAVRNGLAGSVADPGAEPAEAPPAEAAQGVRTLLACAIREVEEETGQRLGTGIMHPWANLVTPPGRSKRFDTYFFVTAGEGLADLAHQTTEATNSEWLSVDDLLTGEVEGRYRLMRPTLALLTELQTLGTVDAVLEQATNGARTIESIRPQVPGIH
ncbi:NUDIX hydrolase [Brevibacterium senegalense]|uniref:NUDIX hydrolase n=1 Tax=Brevibacterium senegalense TaxID=1033736 RepID=UPI0002F8E62F|nr:NUDIX hydrolase [Brevibacterium senegalense]